MEVKAMATLIKIDRNGSKHYVGQVKCDRCGGQGGSDAWRFTGWTCYKCGGTGVMEASWIERTPEYQAKLDARRAKRNAKKLAEEEARLAEYKAREEARKAEEAKRKAEEEAKKAISQYVGEVGDKISKELTYLGSAHFTTHIGWTEQTMYVHNFVDQDGNKFVWKSSSFKFDGEKGDKKTVTGTIKEHKEYKGEKQTMLLRCKIS